MTGRRLHLAAAVLVFAGFVLILLGLGVADWLWMAGLLCVAVAQAVALSLHWLDRKQERKQEQKEGGKPAAKRPAPGDRG